MLRPLLHSSLLLLASAALASGQLVSGDWGYSVSSEAGTGAQVVTIREYKGSGGPAVVPALIDGMPVRTIGGGLGQLDRFNANKLTGIVIPDSVTTIAPYAFWQCYTLASVTLGSNVKTTGYGAFAYCNALASIAIPDSLTTLGDYTFFRARAMTNATLGAGLKSIGIAAFSDSPLLTGMVIPHGVTSIGNFAFNNNTGLSSIVIPDSVITIGSHAFGNCDSLTSIVIPDSVTSIGERAFEQTANLSSVTLGQGLVSIGAGAFWLCDALTSLTIPDGVRELPRDLFFDCANLAAVVIGYGVTNIGQAAFAARSNLTSVVFKGNVPSLVYPVVTTTNNVTMTNFVTHTNVFGSNSSPTVFVLPATTGWGALFGGRTTGLFAPVAGQADFDGASQFTFTWSGTGEVPMNVQRRDSFDAGSWATVATGVMHGAFVDTNPPPRSAYYRSVLP